MNNADLFALLDRLRAEPRETEWLEFKANRYEPQAIGEYLSALANSACLLGKPRGYLVFGIEDGTHAVVGTRFDPQAETGQGNQLLPLWLALGLKPKLGFEMHVCQYHGHRVVVFEVHPAFDRPVEFYGKAFVRNGSSKTSLSVYPEKERAIWMRRVDWSAQVCEQATLADLDPKAIAEARRQYTEKNKTKPEKLADLAEWDDATFLNKAKLTVRGAITNAALLLLGREEASSLLAPAVARVSWILKNERNEELDYEHFGPPMLLNVDKVLARIRNLTVRELPDGTLFPVELTQYDPWVIREALHNCIAHQDYGFRGRIQVVETPQALLLTNVGGFLPGRVETVIEQDAPLEVYRNPYLAEAMVSLNMIDTQGGGIKRMFQAQRRRFFPLPDYDLSQPERVMVTLRGRILDVRYTRLLMAQGELDLATIMLLDKVQKGVRIEPEDAKRLKVANLVEGRYPNLLVAGSVSAAMGDKARHIRNRGFDNRYYRDLIVDLVREHQPVSREDIDKLLLDKLPEVLSTQQKASKVHNLLTSLSGKRIQNVGTRQVSKWVLLAPEKQ
ncbi:MAG: putative DNA binding domain-containing protein [Hydrogenophaga sp.]|uniref:RNA-binding domain-containing protein n=1 Tax=Hydrogenophaga sp. TaxID=1904254 RepID=UPI002718D7DF|nr:RNA-binding domain-containing protein [Hydrogenophaga sp.]MDO9481227.1 putative DNA binding domain-containing protein [Hydrogenophaga sp.]MDP3346992.1 putative DNA binding domain-containing protein [Hydrogenophaga sp.]MDP3808653.1 putative DNA binding domain-containing protein [Hydrogenophaga sp.]